MDQINISPSRILSTIEAELPFSVGGLPNNNSQGESLDCPRQLLLSDSGNRATCTPLFSGDEGSPIAPTLTLIAAPLLDWGRTRDVADGPLITRTTLAWARKHSIVERMVATPLGIGVARSRCVVSGMPKPSLDKPLYLLGTHRHQSPTK
jgi:hypothetical protein